MQTRREGGLQIRRRMRRRELERLLPVTRRTTRQRPAQLPMPRVIRLRPLQPALRARRHPPDCADRARRWSAWCWGCGEGDRSMPRGSQRCIGIRPDGRVGRRSLPAAATLCRHRAIEGTHRRVASTAKSPCPGNCERTALQLKPHSDLRSSWFRIDGASRWSLKKAQPSNSRAHEEGFPMATSSRSPSGSAATRTLAPAAKSA